MPTGYTAAIKDGITFKEFALNCARNFGACISMRDEPNGTPIPDKFIQNDYHLNKKKELQEEYSLLSLEDNGFWLKKVISDTTKKEDQRIKWNNEKLELKNKYLIMLNQVNDWVQPSSDHIHMKEFMVQQIEESIEWDCDVTYYSEPTKLPDALEYKNKILRELEKDIAYHSKQHEEEVERVSQRNKWVKLLRESLD